MVSFSNAHNEDRKLHQVAQINVTPKFSRLLSLIVFTTLWMQHSSAAVDEASTTKNKSVEITKGINGLDKVVLRQIDGSTAEVYLYGAHVTSWKNKHGEELLFLSSKAFFEPPKAIRGGIPIVFPQFSNLGPLKSHGFARNRFWIIDTNPPPFHSNPTSKVFVDLLLNSTDEDLQIWPHSFIYRLRVSLGPEGDLIMTSRIKNTDKTPFNFTFAYHNYFSALNISDIQVKGLKALDYLDNLQNRTRFTEQRDAITFKSEVDRIYLNTPKKIAILNHNKKRTFFVRKDGLPDAVVWNPWQKNVTDLGTDDYKLMVAVEAGAIGNPVTLNPSKEWKATQKLSVV